MGLWTTGLPRRGAKLEKLARRLEALEGSWDGDTGPWLDAAGIGATGMELALGTVGSGNHFAELQTIEEVRDAAAFSALGLAEEEMVMLVHSGSRGYGDALLQEHVRKHRDAGLKPGTDEAADYLRKHAVGVAWATANRALIAHRFLAAIRGEGKRVLDICHNSVTAAAVDGCSCWLHRKGAAPSDKGPVVIPGSRGDFSYLVRPVGEHGANAFSLPHGAGRKWTRTDSKGRLDRRYRAEDLKRTDLGGIVIFEDKELLFEEAPQAYKNAASVVGDVVDAGLVEVIAVLRPLITFKTARRRSDED